jgi:hypothetical protein
VKGAPVSKYKDFLLGVQELVWTALELGARDENAIYAYVYMYEPRVTESMVHDILEDMVLSEIYDAEDYQLGIDSP